MSKDKFKKMNIYKPGTVEYYRDQLGNIVAVTKDYDGFCINSAKQMKELVDDLRDMAEQALNHKKLYCTCQMEKK